MHPFKGTQPLCIPLKGTLMHPFKGTLLHPFKGALIDPSNGTPKAPQKSEKDGDRAQSRLGESGGLPTSYTPRF